MNAEDLKKVLNYEVVYGDLIPSLRLNGNGTAAGLCPFHDDHDPSLDVTLDTGLWICRAGCGGGDVFKLYMRSENASFVTAISYIERIPGAISGNPARQKTTKPKTPQKEIEKKYEQCQKLIQEKPDRLMKLAEVRKFKDKLRAINLMRKHKVSIDHLGNWIFPLLNINGSVRGLQRYNHEGVATTIKNGETTKMKATAAMMYGHQVGIFGCRELINHSVIHSVIACESPIKALHMQLQGFDGANGTLAVGVIGAGHLPEDQRQIFNDKVVLFCYDFDFKKNNPGQKGVEIDEEKIRDVARKIKNIKPSEEIIQAFKRKGYGKADLADDYWLEGGSIETFNRLVKEALPVLGGEGKEANTATKAIDFEACYGNIPTLDKSVYTGIFKSYIDILHGSTEAPDEYHFYFLLTVLGLIIGKRAHVFYGRRVYPNFYFVLIGPSGKARKTTAMRFAKELLKALKPNVKIITGVPSGESLVRTLHGSGFISLVYQEEFATILKKANQEANNTIPRLTEIYDVPDEIENPTKVEPALAKDFLLSFVAGSTREWLTDTLNIRDIHGGFANRFGFVVGKLKKPIPLPVPYDQRLWNNLVQKIHVLDMSLRDKKDFCLNLTDEAKQLWVTYYKHCYERKWSSHEMSLLAERLTEKVYKIALVYAVINGCTAIEAGHLDMAIKVGKHLEGCIVYLFSNVGQKEAIQEEQKILTIIKKAGSIEQSKLHQHFGSRISSERLKRILEGLASLQRIEILIEGPRKKKTLRAI